MSHRCCCHLQRFGRKGPRQPHLESMSLGRRRRHRGFRRSRCCRRTERSSLRPRPQLPSRTVVARPSSPPELPLEDRRSTTKTTTGCGERGGPRRRTTARIITSSAKKAGRISCSRRRGGRRPPASTTRPRGRMRVPRPWRPSRRPCDSGRTKRGFRVSSMRRPWRPRRRSAG